MESQQIDELADTIATSVVAHLQKRECRLLNRSELARCLGISERGLTGLVKRREIPPGFLIGGVRRWDWTDVRRHLEAHATRGRRKGRGRYDRRAVKQEPEAAAENAAPAPRVSTPSGNDPADPAADP